MRRNSVRVRHRQDHYHRGTEPVGDPPLVPEQLPRPVRLTGGPGTDGLHIRPRMRLSQRERASPPSARQLRQQLVALAIIAGESQQRSAQRVWVQHPRRRQPAAGELLHDPGVDRQAQAEPPMLARHGGAEQSERTHPLQDQLRENVVLSMSARGWQHDIIHESPDGVHQCVICRIVIRDRRCSKSRS